MFAFFIPSGQLFRYLRVVECSFSNKFCVWTILFPDLIKSIILVYSTYYILHFKCTQTVYCQSYKFFERMSLVGRIIQILNKHGSKHYKLFWKLKITCFSLFFINHFKFVSEFIKTHFIHLLSYLNDLSIKFVIFFLI